MVSRELVEKVLHAGAQAPSGSNSQPWRFEADKGVISVHMIPERDHPILNFKERGTLLACGALLENMEVAAIHFGLSVKVTLFPEKSDRNFVARVTLAPGGNVPPAGADLFGAIERRATNRKPFETRRVNDVIKASFTNIPAEIGEPGVELKVVDDRDSIKALAAAASANEVVMFEDEELHRLLFQEIVWTDEEERRKKSGLFLKTMELAPPQRAALRMFRSWPFMRFANALGAARGIARGNAKGYAACALYGAVLCGPEDRDFVNAGRAIERAWLTATAHGLAFHLQTGVNFLWQRVSAGGKNNFSEGHVNIIKRDYAVIAKVFGANPLTAADGRIIPAIFRIGYGPPPTARSSKKPPEVVFK